MFAVAVAASLLLAVRGASGDDACGKKDLAAARARFNDLYKAKKYQEAFDELAKTKDRCWAGLGPDDRGAWRAISGCRLSVQGSRTSA